MRKSEITIVIIIALSFILALALMPQMPEKMASHWDLQGRVNGYMPRFWALFLMPMVSLFIFLLFLLVPKIDPLKENIKKFRKYFDSFIVLIIIFLLYVYLLSIAWNLGYRFDMGRLIVPATGLLFYYVGVLLSKAKRNWFIGVRTPWTLSSEKVWDRTNKAGAKLFKVSGLIAFLAIVWPKAALYIIFLPLVLTAVFLVFYSYFLFQKEKIKFQKEKIKDNRF